MSPNSKWLRWKWCWPDCISSVDSAPSATLPSVGLSPSCTSFLSLTHFFYPWITSSLNSTLPRHFPDLVLFSSWRFCGNNESEGTCFLQCSQCRVLTLVPAGNTCGSPPVLPEGEGAERGGARRLLLNSPTLCHPPPRFLLPDELWLAGLIVQLRRQTLEAWGDFPTFISLLRRKKPLSPSPICGQWCPVRSLLTYLLTKSLSLKENFCFSGSEYFTRSVCHLIQEVSITGNPFIESIETAKKKIQDDNSVPSMNVTVQIGFQKYSLPHGT